MANRTWKIAEQSIAGMMGGRRVSNTALGLRSADVETDAYSVEIKTRKAMPAWLMDAVNQAHRNCVGDRLALVVLHTVGQRRVNDLVVLRLGEFIEQFGDPEPVPFADEPEED